MPLLYQDFKSDMHNEQRMKLFIIIILSTGMVYSADNASLALKTPENSMLSSTYFNESTAEMVKNETTTFDPLTLTPASANSSSSLPQETASDSSSPPLPSRPKVPDDYAGISEEEANAIIEVMEKIRFPLEMMSGVLTFTSGCVYLLPDMRSPTAYYLVSMNFLDTVSVIMGNIGLAWRLTASADVTTTEAYNKVQEVCLRYMAQWTRRCVYWLAVLVSTERFFALSFPLQARFIKIIRYPKLTILAVVVVCAMFHTYQFAAYSPVYDPRIGQYRLGVTRAYETHPEVFNILLNAAMFLFAYIPLFAGVCLSIALFVVLRRSSRARATLTGTVETEQARKTKLAERQLSRTIWMSNALFTFLSLPINTINLVSVYHPTFGPGRDQLDRHLYFVISQGAFFFLVASRFTNFLSYASLSTSFRRNLLRVFVLCPSVLALCRRSHNGGGGERNREEENRSDMFTLSSSTAS